MKHPIKLPPGFRLEVEGPGGRRYPAWIERWTRRVYAACGQVAYSIPVLIFVERILTPNRTLDGLVEKLERWGYRHVARIREEAHA